MKLRYACSPSGFLKFALWKKVKPNITTLKLTFLGTRGEIEVRSRRHRRHSSLLVQRDEARIMIDCGTDWLGQLHGVAPTAIVLTHAHPDHAAGLAEGAPCPVYATKITWDLIRRFPIYDRRRLPLRKSIMIDGVRFRAFPVEHSMRAPAVGFRISADGGCFFYVPDVAGIPDTPHALRGVNVYIGDGATMKRSMVRWKRRTVVGHAPISRQLDWCERANVRRAIFTHCGSPIVRGDARKMNAALRQLGRERGVEARIASDGDRLSFADGRHQSRSRRVTKRA
jgi:phosphoribosyl 1,2-cyclic phosphodiesterase